MPSGIPDFRSPGTGLWENVDPMEVAHIDAWRRDPDRFWSFYGQRFASLIDKRPNRAHEVVAELERRGLVRGVITQNIDRLHRMAGSEPRGGDARLDRVEPLHDLQRAGGAGEGGGAARGGDGAPECEACVAPLKPDVVLFGELLPDEPMAEAQAMAAEADLMLCIGSSLTVYPVAGLPGLTQAGGGKIALVTEGETPYDAEADVKLDGDVVAELEAVLEALDS